MEAVVNNSSVLETVSGESLSALVSRSLRKDHEAFSELIGRYERSALSVAFSVLGSADAASDVVQEGFLRTWERLAELKEPRQFGSWLCGIVRNLAIDFYRRGRHMKLAPAETFDAVPIAEDRPGADPLEELSRHEQHERVAKALRSLDDVTRPMVVMRYYEGLSSKQIAERLEMSPAAVDMRLSRARQQLRTLLEPSGASADT